MSKPREISLAAELYSDENFRTRCQLQWGNLFVTWIFYKINSSGNGLIWVPRQAIRCFEERQLTMIRYRTILRHSLSNCKFRQFFAKNLFFCWLLPYFSVFWNIRKNSRNTNSTLENFWPTWLFLFILWNFYWKHTNWLRNYELN